MLLLVVAATDQTGRTITMLSAALVAVAMALVLLTVWYWRFTSPKRRAAAEPAVVEHAATEDRPSGSETPASVEPSPAEPDSEPDSELGPEPESSSGGDGSAIGLDSEEWAMLTQAVMDEYLDS